jgi:hypothetical protein
MSASDESSSKSSKPWDTGGRRCRFFHRIGKPDSQTIARDVYFRVMVQVSRSADQKVWRFVIFWWPLICQLYSFDDSEPIWPAIVIPLTRNPSRRCVSMCWCRLFALLLICWSVILLLSLIFVRSLFSSFTLLTILGPFDQQSSYLSLETFSHDVYRCIDVPGLHFYSFAGQFSPSFSDQRVYLSFFWRQARVSVFSFYRPLK